MTGMIYFLSRGHGTRERLKIGFSVAPERRMRELQTGSDERLELLGKVKGTLKQEKHIHSLLWNWRLKGEWFEGSVAVRRFISDALSYGLTAAISELQARNLEYEWSGVPRSDGALKGLGERQKRLLEMQSEVDRYGQ